MSAVTPAGGDTTAARSWPALLNGLLDGRDLSADDTAWALDVIMRGEATDAQIAAFAVGLRFKGETVEEISGLVRTMYDHANVIEVPGRDRRPRRHRRRRRQAGQHLHHVGVVWPARARQRRQARQPGRLLGVRRLRRPWRNSACNWR
ncbi:Anthranilate phosphoribosyltransferase [Streptomyces tendae]